MGNAWQSWLALALVVLAAAYSIWYWLPTRFRKALGAVHQSLAEKPSCGSCSSCGKCAVPGPVASAANTQPIRFHTRH